MRAGRKKTIPRFTGGLADPGVVSLWGLFLAVVALLRAKGGRKNAAVRSPTVEMTKPHIAVRLRHCWWVGRDSNSRPTD